MKRQNVSCVFCRILCRSVLVRWIMRTFVFVCVRTSLNHTSQRSSKHEGLTALAPKCYLRCCTERGCRICLTILLSVFVSNALCPIALPSCRSRWERVSFFRWSELQNCTFYLQVFRYSPISVLLGWDLGTVGFQGLQISPCQRGWRPGWGMQK